MPSCYVCGKQRATIHFPRDHSVRGKWVRSLELESEPPANARLCQHHFGPNDFRVSPFGLKFLKKGVLPTREVGPMRSVFSDHSYFVKTRPIETGTTEMCLMLAPLVMCFIPIIIMFFYCWGDQHQDYELPPIRNRVKCVTLGE